MSQSFADELHDWGPGRTAEKPVSLAEGEAYCRRLATSHYENFPVVSWLLPRRLQQPFYNVYAYCRWADDLADELDDPQQSLELLGWWRNQLEACYRGETSHPVFVALQKTIRDFSIPAEPFEDLLSAFEQDQTVHEYQTYDQLLDYCRRSANPVGRLVLILCGLATPEFVKGSDSICTGLQLANFWQDVSRDLDKGRIYLPAEDMQRFGYTRDELVRRQTTPAFLELMKFEVERTRPLLRPWFEQKIFGSRPMSFRMQVEITLFAKGGLKVLERIEQIGYRVLEERPVLRKWDYVTLLYRTIWRTLRKRIFHT